MRGTHIDSALNVNVDVAMRTIDEMAEFKMPLCVQSLPFIFFLLVLTMVTGKTCMLLENEDYITLG